MTETVSAEETDAITYSHAAGSLNVQPQDIWPDIRNLAMNAAQHSTRVSFKKGALTRQWQIFILKAITHIASGLRRTQHAAQPSRQVCSEGYPLHYGM